MPPCAEYRDAKDPATQWPEIHLALLNPDMLFKTSRASMSADI